MAASILEFQSYDTRPVMAQLFPMWSKLERWHWTLIAYYRVKYNMQLHHSSQQSPMTDTRDRLQWQTQQTVSNDRHKRQSPTQWTWTAHSCNRSPEITSFYTITMVASNPISVFTLFSSFMSILFVYFGSHMNSMNHVKVSLNIFNFHNLN